MSRRRWKFCLVYGREARPTYERTNQEKAEESSKSRVEQAWRSGIDAKVGCESNGVNLVHTPPEVSQWKQPKFFSDQDWRGEAIICGIFAARMEAVWNIVLHKSAVPLASTATSRRSVSNTESCMTGGRCTSDGAKESKKARKRMSGGRAGCRLMRFWESCASERARISGSVAMRERWSANKGRARRRRASGV